MTEKERKEHSFWIEEIDVIGGMVGPVVVLNVVVVSIVITVVVTVVVTDLK